MVRRRGGAADEKLEDVFTDRSSLYVSEIDTVCDQIDFQQITATGVVPSMQDPQPVVKEFSENACAEAASESSTMEGKGTVRFCIAGKTEHQMGGRVGDDPVVVRRELAVLYLRPDGIEDQIGGDLGVGSRNLEQEAVLGEGLVVVLFG